MSTFTQQIQNNILLLPQKGHNATLIATKSEQLQPRKLTHDALGLFP